MQGCSKSETTFSATALAGEVASAANAKEDEGGRRDIRMTASLAFSYQFFLSAVAKH